MQFFSLSPLKPRVFPLREFPCSCFYCQYYTFHIFFLFDFPYLIYYKLCSNISSPYFDRAFFNLPCLSSQVLTLISFKLCITLLQKLIPAAILSLFVPLESTGFFQRGSVEWYEEMPMECFLDSGSGLHLGRLNAIKYYVDRCLWEVNQWPLVREHFSSCPSSNLIHLVCRPLKGF